MKYGKLNLEQVDAIVDKLGGMDGVHHFLSGESVVKMIVPKSDSLLEFIDTVKVPAITERFVARDKFVTNKDQKAPVKISYVGDNFREWFLDKIEEPISEVTLRYQKLRENSVDGPIIAELGGEKKAETTLTEIYALMEKQRNDKDGVLLTNGYANIFYVRDVNVVLCTVDVRWDVGGWGVFALPVGGLVQWLVGHQVFSRNFLES